MGSTNSEAFGRPAQICEPSVEKESFASSNHQNHQQTKPEKRHAFTTSINSELQRARPNI
jgi:hypothetical protein